MIMCSCHAYLIYIMCDVCHGGYQRSCFSVIFINLFIAVIYDSILRLTKKYIFIRTNVTLTGDAAFLFHACSSR